MLSWLRATPSQRPPLVALRAPGTSLSLQIDHPNYKEKVDLSEEVRASLAADLDA